MILCIPGPVGWGAISLRELAPTLWPLQGYMQPLKQPENSLLCDPSLVDEIFDQIPELLEHHEQFLEQVRHCVQNWHAQQKVGGLLVQSVSGPAVPAAPPPHSPAAPRRDRRGLGPHPSSQVDSDP